LSREGWGRPPYPGKKKELKRMIAMPEYFGHIEWEYVDGVPVMKGFRADAPKEKLEQWKREMRDLQRLVEENPDKYII